MNPIWLTDSRQVIADPQNTVFFAIPGTRHDGHLYINELYERGVRQFVVQQGMERPEWQALPDAELIRVPNVLGALQQEAARHRAQFSIPVVGITGSNGKTIVKEWLAQLLATDFVIARSPKSYNSQVGVPLSVHQLNGSHTLGIFEAGISAPHEMANLEPIVAPTIGVFTNIGTAHDEGFRSRKQKVAEKLRLFTHAPCLIYRKDYSDIDEEIRLLLKAVNPAIRLVSWSTTDQTADFTAGVSGSALLLSRSDGTRWHLQLPFTDPASVENLIHCLLVLLELGLTNEVGLQTRLNRLRPVSMRLELKEGIHNSVLIDDSYNNDVAGLQLALNFLNQQRTRPRQVIILSDVLQSGQPEADLYTQIGQLITEQHPDLFVGIGPVMNQQRSHFPAGSAFYPDTESFLAQLPAELFRDAVVLVKGARSFTFERIINRLQRKVHGTVLHINLDALTHNLNYYRAKVSRSAGPSQTKIMVMVKAFAYGSGSVEVAQLLQFNRVDYLAVAYADEGVQLRQNGVDLPIMVMNPAPETFATLLDHRLEPEIYSLRLLREWCDFVQTRPHLNPDESVRLHLKIDTGMHRLGFLPDDLPAVIALLNEHPNLRVSTVFSHLVGADEAQFNAFSQEQYMRFVQATTQLEAGLGYLPTRHLLNSAGIVRFPEFQLDMVRLGIGLYGVESSQIEPGRVLPVGTLRTVISQIKTVPAGDTVGYSRRGVLDHDARIATLAIGYADGYDRRFGNGVGKIWVNGTLCPTVGNICMDMTMIDVTGASVSEGDEVEIFGPNVSVKQLAHQIGTIPYELLTNVSDRVKRVFYKE
ncbi:bifunctional UDP-N-acetylmuramoyl-tripeptide:D-alanyl-D-alanine ligase/alanine racemase [Rudanella lutea]|uniref:bifunctional UDP-N-acetylmuramoyl-tripeptide:D-alanyl-D-alanine ligase/alanine racemase n=1 Tax=Rudanella lutea TaxID=451374 RepID=UPI00036FCC57|nr:bifunctional UDP-N-acetylmuramoyl-tripeptide:D-alanyl-D-alanine ligase/alanine racemase [Rudanella lutea]